MFGILFIVLFVAILGPAVFALYRVNAWREAGEGIDGPKRAIVGGLFAPAIIFLLFVLLYVFIGAARLTTY